MIEEIKSKNSALVDLNSNLEIIVEQKTVELKRSVDFTQELLEKQDQFVKNAIHEINTPLSIILMNIDLYNLKFEKNPYLLKIEAAVKVLDNIYEDLAYVVKKDRVVYEKAMIDFSKFLTERVDYFEDVAEGNKLHISMEIMPDLFILFNETELQRICDNNLSNAIKYSYEKQPLHVKLYDDDNEVVFEVENCGETIKSPDQLFNRYYREDEARGGFGLGLNIVKGICDTNGVSIEVLSDESKTLFRYRFVKG
jgi:signal transduction histidine kinase